MVGLLLHLGLRAHTLEARGGRLESGPASPTGGRALLAVCGWCSAHRLQLCLQRREAHAPGLARQLGESSGICGDRLAFGLRILGFL